MNDKARFTLVEQQDREAIVAVTQRFLTSNSKVASYSITCERIEGSFARVRAQDNQGKTSAVVGFTRRNKEGNWEVLSLGTYFEPEFYKANGIPEKLRKA